MCGIIIIPVVLGLSLITVLDLLAAMQSVHQDVNFAIDGS